MIHLNYRLTVCVFLFFIFNCRIWAIPDEKTSIHLGEIRLGNLISNSEIDYYDVIPIERFSKMSIALYGHVHQPDDPNSHPLSTPLLILERQDKRTIGSNWFQIEQAQPARTDIQIARIQNYSINPNYQYRIGVSTLSPNGGRYALIIDPVMEGYEFEVEDIDLGKDSDSENHSLSASYCVPDESSRFGERIYAGTEKGYILTSNDDAKTWQQLYPPKGQPPLHGTVFGLFVDSQGIIYASPWTAAHQVQIHDLHGFVLESRNGGKTWNKAAELEWPTGVGWRMAEDKQGNVFIGEYSSVIDEEGAPRYAGNVWRRKNHGNNGEKFEVVFANPCVNPDTKLNHTHYVGVDPYTDDVYAAIGDGSIGCFIRSKHHGDPGTWDTLERGVDAQYTSMAFTPQYLYLGTDTNRMFKKIVRWEKDKSYVSGYEPFWTTTSMERLPGSPISWADKGNWFWGHFIQKKVLVFCYMPYGDLMDNGQMQPPRIYAGMHDGEEWWRLITFPPNPIRNVPKWGENGPKFSSNISPNGWIYSMRGTVSSNIHRGFRFRLKNTESSCVQSEWMEYR